MSQSLFLLFLLLIAEHSTSVSGLTCEWQTGSGWLRPSFGTYLKLNTTDITECKQQCMTQTTFICVAVNYLSSRNTANCEIQAETDQTATIKGVPSGWSYYLRPRCAGIWKPWKTTEGQSPESGYQSGDQKLKDCMSNCLQDNRTDNQNCRGIVKSRNDDTNQCTLVDADATFYRPSWYLDDSPGATKTEVKYFDALGRAFMMLTSYRIEVEGYLVGWKYYIGNRANYCESYADIWRKGGGTYRRIAETLLTPKNTSTGGVRFQYVQNSTTLVKKGDFLVVHVENYEGCEGNLVSFQNSGPIEKVYGNASNDMDKHPTTLRISQTKDQVRKVAIKAYVAEILNVDILPSTSHPESSSVGEVQLSWQVPAGVTDESSPGLLYISVECSTSSSFSSSVRCQDVPTPIEDFQTTLTLEDVRQPYYARVQIIRNYNGHQLPYSQKYAVNNNSTFCTGRGQLSHTTVNISEGGILKPGEPRMIKVSIPSIQDGRCLSATITMDSNVTENPDQANRWSFSIAQGMTFQLGIELNLLGGNRHVILNESHTTQQAPPAPENLNVVSRANTSADLAWNPPEYANEYASITGYEVECFITNNTFNKQATFESNQNTRANITGLHLEALYSQVEYTWRVKALLPSDGYGESSVREIFWTLPAWLTLQWPARSTRAPVGNTLDILLPNITEAVEGYEFMQVVVAKLTERRKRSSRFPEINGERVYVTARFSNLSILPTSFTIGDNRSYGGQLNKPLTIGSYTVYLQFKALTEEEITQSVIVPGAERISVKNTSPTTGGTPKGDGTSLPAVIGGAVGGLVAAVVVVIFVIFIQKKRTKSPPSNSSHLSSAPSESADTMAFPLVSTSPPAIMLPDHDAPLLSKPTRPIVLIKPVTSDPSADLDGTYENLDCVKPPNPPSHSIPVSQLHRVIETEQQTNPQEPFKKEYLTIKSPERPCKVGRQPENINKNRFKNITAADSTRVVLSLSDGFDSDYINANYIEDYNGSSRYIASQGPNDRTIEDMWRLIHESNAATIVMLTNPIEATKKKCSIYWPENVQHSVAFGRFEITLVEEQRYAEYIIRKLKYKYSGRARHVRQFHFTEWPDHGVPTTPGLLSFRHRVKQDMGMNRAPVIVHCSAGVGRTGTFIGLDILIEEAHATVGKGREGTVDVFSCVYTMRTQRTQMVQTHEQYAFLYSILSEALSCGDTSVSCSCFSDKLSEWRLKSGAQPSALEVQFGGVTSASPKYNSVSFSAGSADSNSDKNRNRDILPSENYRIFLPIITRGQTDYINAIDCDAYQMKRGFIITQTPLPDTVDDFWRMVIDNMSPVIVYFNNCQNELPHWPAEGSEIDLGHVTVQSSPAAVATTPGDGMVEHSLTCIQGKTRHNVTLVEIKMMDDKLLTTDQLISVCTIMEKYATSGKDVITVQCRDGCRLSGIFVIAMNLFLRVRMEQEVDIVLEVKLARRSRPQFISDFESFELLYDFVSTYLSEFNDYSNFR